MSDERGSMWRQVRETVLDVAWRNIYHRWYLITMLAWWAVLAFIIIPRWPGFAPALPVLGGVGQWLIGRVCDTLERWFESEYTCDCPTCTEQRTGGAA